MAGEALAAALTFAIPVVVVCLVVVPFTWVGLRVGRPDRVGGRFLYVLAGSIAAVASLTLGAAIIGGWTHDRGVARSTSACSEGERAALVELGALPTNDEIGTGDRDGSGQAYLAGVGAGTASAHDAVVADVRARLAAQRGDVGEGALGGPARVHDADPEEVGAAGIVEVGQVPREVLSDSSGGLAPDAPEGQCRE